jgi:hypothetical protein
MRSRRLGLCLLPFGVNAPYKKGESVVNKKRTTNEQPDWQMDVSEVANAGCLINAN